MVPRLSVVGGGGVEDCPRFSGLVLSPGQYLGSGVLGLRGIRTRGWTGGHLQLVLVAGRWASGLRAEPLGWVGFSAWEVASRL